MNESQIENDQIRREELLWDDMACTPKHWEQATIDVSEDVDIAVVIQHLAQRVGKKYVCHVVAKYRFNTDAIGEAFLKHLADDVDVNELGDMLRDIVREGINNA